MPPTPGPGQYTQRSTLSGPKFPLGQRLEGKGSEIPGPGTYDESQFKSEGAIKTAPQFS